MNKLFSKVAALSVGLAMAIGVGVGLGSNKATVVRADSYTLVTSTGSLSSGDKVVIATNVSNAPDNGVAGYNGNKDATVSTNEQSWIQFTVGSATDGWTLYDESAEKYIASPSGNEFKYATSGGTCSVDSNGYLVCNGRTLCVNGTNYRFYGTVQNTYTPFSVWKVSGGSTTTYTITYDANGGSGTMADSVGSNPSVAACTFTAPEGMIFSHWNTSADGNGTTYEVGAKPGADLDLYAIWENAPTAVMFEDVGSELPSTASDTMSTTTLVDTYSSDEFTFNYYQCKKQNTSAPYAILLTKDVSPFVSNHTEMPGDIESVELFTNSGASGNATYDVAFGTSEFTTATAGIGAEKIAASSSHVFECATSGAKFFCITLGASYHGQIIKIVVNYSEGHDPSLKDMTIKQSGSPAEGSSYQWSSSADLYQFTAEDEDGAVSNVSWSVSNTSVATIKPNGRLTTVIPGSVTVYAEAEGYNKASASIEIIKGWIEELEVTGSMTKTEYTTQEQWSPAGLVATATFHSGWTENVASQATWTYDPAKPAQGVTSVVATATYDEISASSSAQAVTVTVKHAGTQDDPFTVAEARAQIDGGTDLADKYATGIVSEIVTVYSSQHLNVTFNISVDGTTSAPQLQAYREKSTYSSTVKVGDIVVVGGTLKKYGSTYEFDANCAIVSLTEPTGTKYSVSDRVDYASLDKDEVIGGTTASIRIFPETGYWYPDTLTVLMGGSPAEFTYENGVVVIENVDGNISIEGTCAACSPLKSLYAKPNNAATGSFYGYYVGFLDGTGPVLMDGDYGIVLFASSYDVSSWTEKETIVHISSGTISIFNGLYEVKNFSAEVAESADIEAPVVYATKGGETAEYASRLTTLTGVPTVTSGSFDSAAGTSDIKMNFTFAQQTVQVFYKSAAQTADAEAFAAMKAAVEGGEEITVKGFTSWYNGFQIQMNGYVPPVDDYTAEDFAQDLLDQTDLVCANYESDESEFDTIRAQLVSIWSDLASNDKYPSLPSDQKLILAEAARDEKGTVVEQAMARYDFLTGKYSLSNFIEGRTPISSGRIKVDELSANNNTMIIIVAIAAVSAISLAALLIVKKKKHN